MKNFKFKNYLYKMFTNKLIYKENEVVKVGIKDKNSKKVFNRSLKELNALSILYNPDYIVKLINVFFDYNSKDNLDTLSLVLEKADGDISDENFIDYENYYENFFKQIFYHLLKGLQYIHSKGFFNLDIKPVNILYFKNNNSIRVVYTDFDNYEIYKRTPTEYEELTEDFSSPEAKLHYYYLNPKTDIFSLGCTFYYILNRNNITDQIQNLPGATIDIFSEYVENYINEYRRSHDENDVDYEELYANREEFKIDTGNEDLNDLIINMLQFDFRKRPTIEELLNHKYFEDIKYNDIENLETEYFDAILTSDNNESVIELVNYLSIITSDINIVFNILRLYIIYLNLEISKTDKVYQRMCIYIILKIVIQYFDNKIFDKIFGDINMNYEDLFNIEAELLTLFNFKLYNKMFIDDIDITDFDIEIFYDYLSKCDFKNKSLEQIYNEFYRS